MVVGRLRPIGASAFGDLFFERPSGEVERLDVLEGGVHPVANSFDDFSSLMNLRDWQESSLLTQGVALLSEREIVRGPGQFYGFAPHPAFTEDRLGSGNATGRRGLAFTLCASTWTKHMSALPFNLPVERTAYGVRSPSRYGS